MKQSIYSQYWCLRLALFLFLCATAPSIKAQQLFTDINANLDPAFRSTAIGEATRDDYYNGGRKHSQSVCLMLFHKITTLNA